MKLTLKQRKWVEEYLKSGNATKSAELAGYKNSVSGRENLLKPTVQKAIQELLQERGLSDKYLVEKLKEGLGATRRIGVKEIPDYSVRHRYLDTAFKLKGSFVPERLDVNQPVAIILKEGKDY